MTWPIYSHLLLNFHKRHFIARLWGVLHEYVIWFISQTYYFQAICDILSKAWTKILPKYLPYYEIIKFYMPVGSGPFEATALKNCTTWHIMTLAVNAVYPLSHHSHHGDVFPTPSIPINCRAPHAKSTSIIVLDSWCINIATPYCTTSKALRLKGLMDQWSRDMMNVQLHCIIKVYYTRYYIWYQWLSARLQVTPLVTPWSYYCLALSNQYSLVQDCSNSIANTLELLQSCTKPLVLWQIRYIDETRKLPPYLTSWASYVEYCILERNSAMLQRGLRAYEFSITYKDSLVNKLHVI